jgi:hypothetical protein
LSVCRPAGVRQRAPEHGKQEEGRRRKSGKVRRNAQARRRQAQEHPDRRVPVGAEEERAEADPRALRARNRDLDPQLVWRGKDEQDWSDLVVHAPPLYIQEKVHPKALIDDLLRETKERGSTTPAEQLDLFADFNGIPKGATRPSSTSTTRTGRTA